MSRRKGLHQGEQEIHSFDSELSAAETLHSCDDECTNSPMHQNVVTGGEFRCKDWAVGSIYPIVPNRLSFASFKSETHATTSQISFPSKHFVTADFPYMYDPLCNDFGPVNLGVIHSFSLFMRKLWNSPERQKAEIVFFCSDAVDVRTNCAFLLAAYLVVEHHYSAAEAWEPFHLIRGNAFAMYRDASPLPQEYDLSIPSCLEGLCKAKALGWYSPDTFNAEEYDFFDDPRNMDMHMMTPKFAAFKGPVTPSSKRSSSSKSSLSKTTSTSRNGHTFPPEHFIEPFKKKGITAVVRLNHASTYDAKVFTEAGIRHFDLYFEDCTVPSNSAVLKFLEISAKHKRIAVHCKAGLGRTGTLIAAYMIKHNRFTAAESIGWLRIVRPGSVLGCQQQYLHFLERALGIFQRTPLPSLPETIAEESSCAGEMENHKDQKTDMTIKERESCQGASERVPLDKMGRVVPGHEKVLVHDGHENISGLDKAFVERGRVVAEAVLNPSSAGQEMDRRRSSEGGLRRSDAFRRSGEGERGVDMMESGGRVIGDDSKSARGMYMGGVNNVAESSKNNSNINKSVGWMDSANNVGEIGALNHKKDVPGSVLGEVKGRDAADDGEHASASSSSSSSSAPSSSSSYFGNSNSNMRGSFRSKGVSADAGIIKGNVVAFGVSESLKTKSSDSMKSLEKGSAMVSACMSTASSTHPCKSGERGRVELSTANVGMMSTSTMSSKSVGVSSGAKNVNLRGGGGHSDGNHPGDCSGDDAGSNPVILPEQPLSGGSGSKTKSFLRMAARRIVAW